MKAKSGGAIGLVCGYRAAEDAKMLRLAVLFDAGLVFARANEIDALVASSVVFIPPTVAEILLVSGLTKIDQPIIGLIAINVIDITLRELAMNV